MEGLSSSVNLLVLPILGGYWLQYKFIGSHYRAERLTPQRLVFHAGLFGLGLVVAARLLIFLGESQSTNLGWDFIQYLLYCVVPAFIVLVLSASVALGVRLCLRRESDIGDPKPRGIWSALVEGQGPLSQEMLRAGLGIYIALILAGTSVTIVKSTGTLPPLKATIVCAGLVCFLLFLSWLYQLFINRYVPLSFFTIVLRVGLFGVVASFALTCFFDRYAIIGIWWDGFFHLHDSGIPTLACLLGLVLWWPLNLLYPHQAANLRLHEKQATTALDRLLYQASLEQHLLSISMQDGKVYIGYIQQLPPNPEDRNSYFEILPVHSGYRHKDTRELVLTTFYDRAYLHLLEIKAGPEKWLEFLKVLKIDDIVSAGRFDPEIYVKMQAEAGSSEELAESIIDGG